MRPAAPDHVVKLGLLPFGVPAEQVPADPADRPGHQQHGDPAQPGRVPGGRLQRAAVIAERQVLHAEQEVHHQVAEQPGGHPGQRQHDPEPRAECRIAVAGHVGLLGGPAAGRQAPADQRRRYPDPPVRPGRRRGSRLGRLGQAGYGPAPPYPGRPYHRAPSRVQVHMPPASRARLGNTSETEVYRRAAAGPPGPLPARPRPTAHPGSAPRPPPTPGPHPGSAPHGCFAQAVRCA